MPVGGGQMPDTPIKVEVVESGQALIEAVELQQRARMLANLLALLARVETEGARGLELTGTVQWMAEGDRNYAVGIKFGNLNAAQSAALTNALKAVGEPPA